MTLQLIRVLKIDAGLMATSSPLKVKGNVKDGMVRARDEDAEIIVLTLQDRPPTPNVGHRPDRTFLKP